MKKYSFEVNNHQKDIYKITIKDFKEKNFSEDKELLQILNLKSTSEFFKFELSFYDKNGNHFLLYKDFLEIYCKDKNELDKFIKILSKFNLEIFMKNYSLFTSCEDNIFTIKIRGTKHINIFPELELFKSLEILDENYKSLHNFLYIFFKPKKDSFKKNLFYSLNFYISRSASFALL